MGGSDGEVYCVCRKGDNGDLMIECENCEDWFHGKCVKVTRKQANRIKSYICPICLEADHNQFILFKDGTKTRSVNVEQPASRPSVPAPAPKPVPPPVSPVANDENVAIVPSKAKQPSRTNQRAAPVRASAQKPSISQRQCTNPDCRQAAIPPSKYCSEQCGRELAKIRLTQLFEPTADEYMRGGNHLLEMREEEGQRLMAERDELLETARNLEASIDQLMDDIQIIRREAQAKMEREEDDQNSTHGDDEDESDNETEAASADASKASCVSCGASISISSLLKHWASCFKKYETMYTYSTNFEHVDIPYRDYFQKPLFCDREVRNKDRPLQYCKRLLYICPEHNNAEEFKYNNEDVCGCPMTISQGLVFDGNYCTESKRDCTQHYQWERFRRAHIDIERLQVYQKLNEVTAKLAMISENINRQGGGILGIMLHKSISELSAEPEDVNMEVVDNEN